MSETRFQKEERLSLSSPPSLLLYFSQMDCTVVEDGIAVTEMLVRSQISV